MTNDTLRTLVERLICGGAMALTMVPVDQADDPTYYADLADPKYGHPDLLDAEAGTLDGFRIAYPVVTYQGVRYGGGVCALPPLAAVLDSFVGGQFDDLHDILTPMLDAMEAAR